MKKTLVSIAACVLLAGCKGDSAGTVISGALPYASFQQQIDRLLNDDV